MTDIHEATVTLQTDRFTIIDDVLSPPEVDLVWNYFQAQDFRRIDEMGLGQHWSLDDASALKGPTVGYRRKWDAEYPTNTPIDAVVNSVVDCQEAFKDSAGVLGLDWDSFSAVPYIYRRGTGLLWHRDHPNNSGSYTYYAHPEWNIEWGGELMLSAAKEIDESLGTYFHKLRDTKDQPGEGWMAHLDNRDASKLLMEWGHGHFVAPKPNRMVIIRGGVPHAINRIRDAAGSAVRASISGFFKRPGSPVSGEKQ